MGSEGNETLNYCQDCGDMLKLVDTDAISWFPGLFTKLVFLSTLSILTTTANLFLIYIAYRTKSLVSNTKVFFISLCIAHLLGSLIVIPFWVVTRFSPETAVVSPCFCQIASFVWTLMILASFYSLSAISLDRFFIISNPMRYPIKATTSKKLTTVTCLWVFCVTFACVPIMGWGEYKFKADAIPICGINTKSSLSFTILLIVLGFAAPLTVDIFCCARIISIARRQARSIDARKGSSGSTSSIVSSMSASSTASIQPVAKLSKLKQKLNSIRLVFAGTGSFLVCWCPYLGAHIWMTSVRTVDQAESSMPYVLEFVVMCLALMNGLVNPIVIMCSNRDYRKRIKLVLFRKFGIFKDDVIEDRSDLDSSVSRRSQQRNLNLNEIFQNITHFQPEGLAPDTFIKSQNSETLDSCQDVNSNHTDKLQTNMIVHLHECKRLMSQSSMCSVESDSNLDHVTVEDNAQISPRTIVHEELEEFDIPGIVVK